MTGRILSALVALVFGAVTLSAQTVTQTMYLDFGYNNSSSKGMQTSDADANGNYWTNIYSEGTDKYVFPGTTFSVVNSKNQDTGYTVFINTRFSANGKSGGGGLLSPSADLLGDLAVASATEDYLYTEGHQNYIHLTFKGLDKTKGYRFHTFGSRSSSDTRTVAYRFQGQTSVQNIVTTGGTGISSTGSNGNDNIITTSDIVFPDNAGNITFTLIKISGSYVPVNAMKIEELSGADNPEASLTMSKKLFVDFGENNSDSRGHQTSGADGNGNYWNNVYCQSGNVIANADYDLVDAGNNATSFKLNVPDGFKTNGMSGGGGLTSPSSDYLGDLAIATATEDYAFLETTTDIQMTFSGLDKQKCYRFYFFGSRSAGDGNSTRDAMITLSGLDSWSYLMTTSGSSIGGKGVQGNAFNVCQSDYMWPDGDGKIVFTFAKNTNYAHLNAMKVEEYSGGTRPSGEVEYPDYVYVRGTIAPDDTKLQKTGTTTYGGVVDLSKTVSGTYNAKTFYLSDETGTPYTSTINLNNGTYDITFDIATKTYTFNNSIDENRISVFGSSVSNGQGATNNHGYAYMYDELLQSRVSEGLSNNAFRISSVAINGNNTTNLLGRYDDLIHDFGKYVIFGLSLGNEGIHGASNQQNIFNQFRDNMQTLIGKVRADGKVPVVMNNYTRTDFTASDYEYIKQMNLLIHEWDLPSVNMLGAIDDGTGKWATNYQNPGDIYHPTTDGHREFYYAMVPSLFDALAAGKPLPERTSNTSLTLKNKSVIEFTGEETIHPFALSMTVKGKQEGRVASFRTESGNATITVGADGKVSYNSPSGSKLTSTTTLDNDSWHYVTLSHYWAQKRTLLFVDGEFAGELSEQLVPTRFTIGDISQSTERNYGELFFWRSALNADEVAAVVSGKMLKSSLDIYASLSDGETTIENKAQSMNTLEYVEGSSADELAGVWIIGAEGSVGKPSYGEGTGWNTDNAIRMEQLPNNIYKVDLTVGESLNKDFVNFKFFGQAGWGIEFKGDGNSNYNVTSDSDLFGIGTGDGLNGNVCLKDGKTLEDGDTYLFFLDCSNGTDNAVMHVEKRVSDVDGIWIIGAEGSVGEPAFGEGDGWNADNAIAMTEESDGIFSYTFTVGENLNKDFVNFKFFGQAGWGIEYKGTGATPYMLSSTSDLFLVGDGTNGHDNGNIYLAEGAELTDGDMYIMTINVTEGADKAVLSVVKYEPEIIPDVEGIWIIGASGSVGDPAYTDGTNWEPANAIAMTEVSDKVYEYTFVVGKSLNKDFVNFKFFGQAGWGIEFLGSEGAMYHLTSESDVFLVGDGNGHDNGNIYLAEGAELTDGDEWKLTVDCSGGYRNSVLRAQRGGDETGISQVSFRGELPQHSIYDLQGRKVSNPHRGIYIMNGKKVVIR